MRNIMKPAALAASMTALLTSTALAAPMYSITDLGDLPGGGDYSVARAINDNGQVVGAGGAATGNRGFLWQGGVMTDLGDLPGGGDFSVAYGVNDSGQVVGQSVAATGARGFLWDSGTLFDLNDLLADPAGWELFYAYAINDAGQIVGWGYNGTAHHGFLLTPIVTEPPVTGVPEPMTLSLLGAGLVGLGWVRRKRA